jgi:SAM-dependent methyltransferase
MDVPERSDFETLRQWGLIENPLAAIEDYSEEKEELRWENKYHQKAHEDYKQRREEWQSAHSDEGYYEYYKSTQSRPIDRAKWEFLKLRKSWHHSPLGWGKFASPDVTRILELGCGDGSDVQRIAEYIQGCWMKSSFCGHPMEIVGVDLNEQRIRNSKKLCQTPNENITLSFERGDVIEGLDYADNFFDYVTIPSVLEILPDSQAEVFLNEAARLATKGIYVFDMLDEHPGGHPRENLPELLAERGFPSVERHKVFSQPFTEEGSSDPLEVWPINVGQVIFAESDSKQKPSDKWVDS